MMKKIIVLTLFFKTTGSNPISGLTYESLEQLKQSMVLSFFVLIISMKFGLG